MSRADYHNVIVAYIALVVSVFSLFVDAYEYFPRENIQILRVEDDKYYHFDGEKLFKNFQVTVANNSAVPVSIVKITVERDGVVRTFQISDLPNILPLNLEAGYTTTISFPWNIYTTAEDAQKIREFSQESLKESDIVYPSTILHIGTSYPNDPSKNTSSSNAVTLAITLCTAKNNQYVLITENAGAPKSASSEGNWVASMVLWQYEQNQKE